MAKHAPKLKQLLAGDRRTADQAQRSLLRAEDALTALEDREARRTERTQPVDPDIARRLPAVNPERRPHS